MPEKKAKDAVHPEEAIEKDWETAFQAGDYLLPDEEGLAPSSPAAQKGKGKIRKKHGLAEMLGGGSSKGEAESDFKEGGLFALFFLRPVALVISLVRIVFSFPLQVVPRVFLKRLSFFPKIVLLGFIWAGMLLSVSYYAYRFFHEEEKSRNEIISAEPRTSEVERIAVPSEPAFPPPEKEIVEKMSEHPVREEPVLEQPAVVSDKEDSSLPPGQVRQKKVNWPLRPFFFVVAQPGGKEAVFVEVEVTLVTLLDPGSLLPEDKNAFLRDCIYQYLTNQKLEDLRRYVLNRGVIRTALFQWLQKMWPDNPVQNVIIDKYQLL